MKPGTKQTADLRANYSTVEPPEGLITKVDTMYRISLRGEQAMVDFNTFERWWQHCRDFFANHQGREHELRIKPFLDGLNTAH